MTVNRFHCALTLPAERIDFSIESTATHRLPIQGRPKSHQRQDQISLLSQVATCNSLGSLWLIPSDLRGKAIAAGGGDLIRERRDKL